jgi:hypothetical protein
MARASYGGPGLAPDTSWSRVPESYIRQPSGLSGARRAIHGGLFSVRKDCATSTLGSLAI